MVNVLIQFILPLRLAWKSLVTYKLRSILTIFGIVIGIASVIIVMSAGESVKGLILGQLDAFGSDFIQVEVKAPDNKKAGGDSSAGNVVNTVDITTLKIGDAVAIGKLPNIKSYYAMVMGQSVVSYNEQNKSLNFMGVSAQFFNIDKGLLKSGRYFTDEEDRQLSRVIILGSKVADKLFDGNDPIGKSIKLGKTKFTVVGVMAERGGSFGFDFDQLAYVPLTTAQKLILGIDHLMSIISQAKDPSKQDQTAEDVTSLLAERHNTPNSADYDFRVTTADQARGIIDTVFGGITLLLVAIAGISLIVGGVGIMNIMYVSVTERTFEIGLRKSVGAKPRQILWQFLFEAIVVTLFGGIIGIMVGISFTYVVSLIANYLGFKWNFALPAQSVMIAFGFSALVGLFFGYQPAQKAAKMDPIKALGHNG
ncbi:MAG: ABC transporter permease [bacterium]